MKAGDAYPLLDHWIDVIRDIFPNGTQFDTHSTLDDARIDIDWSVTTGDGLLRDGNHGYRRVVIVFSRRSTSDYDQLHPTLKSISDSNLYSLIERAVKRYLESHVDYDAEMTPFRVDVQSAELNALT